MKRRASRHVTWNTSAAIQAGPVAKPRPHVAEQPLIPELQEVFSREVPIGTLFTLACDVEPEHPWRTSTPLFPFLQLYHPETWNPTYDKAKQCFAVTGGLAMYAGSCRIDETGKGGILLRTLHHTFIIGGGRYIVPNLNWLRPISC
jgi:hypothetical protein